MAFKAARHWKSMLNAMGSQNRSFASTTTPKFAPTAAATIHPHELPKSKLPSGDWVPIMVLGGFMMVVVGFASHSAWQQLAYAPSVQIRKKKRETMPEVYDPDVVVASADKFVNRSFFRKVGHIQDTRLQNDPVRPDPFTRSREVETLKSVGVRT